MTPEVRDAIGTCGSIGNLRSHSRGLSKSLVEREPSEEVIVAQTLALHRSLVPDSG